jgi:hypothetical protein
VGAIQARIGAIAELYDLISQTGGGLIVPVNADLRQIAKAMSASPLDKTSCIELEVEAEALEIDAQRAVPFGLLVSELATNAITTDSRLSTAAAAAARQADPLHARPAERRKIRGCHKSLPCAPRAPAPPQPPCYAFLPR